TTTTSEPRLAQLTLLSCVRGSPAERPKTPAAVPRGSSAFCGRRLACADVLDRPWGPCQWWRPRFGGLRRIEPRGPPATFPRDRLRTLRAFAIRKTFSMQITVEQISPVLVELSVQIDADRVTLEYEKTFGAVQKQSRIKGFRPGKAPKEIVRRVYGSRVDADVIQRLVDETFPQAAAEKQMQPVTTPSVEPERLESGKPFSYKARVEVL